VVRRDDTTELIGRTSIVGAVATKASRGGLIGRTLGKFTVVDELGRGGAGEVYRAEEAQLGRTVVIKVMRRDVAAEGNRTERFLREVKLASRLDHPYAAHVYAYGAEPDGLVWIAMEHVRGMTLDTIVSSRGPMPPALFGPLFARLCEVVHTAHELGIIHRDIKGSNVMVVERAGQMLPKLLDFGIAKDIVSPPTATLADEPAAKPELVESVQLTGQGAILGSPHYMAPEQWGTAADADARTDIYALGVLGYLCLAGKLPFAGVARMALPRAHHEMTPPPLPSSIPAGVAGAIERAMAKSSSARWTSALELATAVQAAIGSNVPETVPLLDPATRDTWSRRGPQPVADAVMRLSRASTTVEADAALHEVVAITCRWFAVVALAQLSAEPASALVRDHVRAVAGRDDASLWLRLARAASVSSATRLPGLDAALGATAALEELATRLDGRDRSRSASALAADVAALPEALKPLEPMLDYRLVAGRSDGTADSWQGARRRDREPVVVWGDPLADGDVALLDTNARVVARLSPLVQVSAPLPSAEPELFLLWRTVRGGARMVAAPWGYERDDDAAAHWLAALTTANDEGLEDTLDEGTPYPGLAAYRSSDANQFVGREREIEALVNRLVAAPLIAVLGASGAGKTSFLQAGVIPRLAEDHDIVSLRPGRHALVALETVAAPRDDDETAEYGGDHDDAAMVARLRARGERAARGLVIVVDQLEELVTLCSDAAERERFAAVLASAASDRDAPVRVVVGLRDDFANVVETLDAFRGRFEVFVLATPSADALRRIIIEPARRAQVTVDSRVVDEMVAEVVGRTGSLPLLSFTATQLWQTRERDRRRITYDAYAAIGGVAGALSTYADQVHASLDRRDQETLRELFGRLVAADGTRIPIPRGELEQLPGARGVLARLIDARLLVVREDAGTDVVEIIHECLATRWDRLVRWRSDDAAERNLLADVRAAARRWLDSGRSADLLWRGVPLAELRQLGARAQGLTDVERSFAAASDRAARRARRLRRGVVAGSMAVLAAVAGSMAYLRVVADQNRSAAELSAQRARAAATLAEDRLTASLIAQGRRELNDGRGLAALAYFGEALRRGADSPALRFMIGVAERGWPDEVLFRERAGTTAVALFASGIVAGDEHGRVAFWSADGKQVAELALSIGPLSRLIRYGDEIVALGARGVAVVDPVRRATRRHIATALPPLDAQLGPGAAEITVVVDRAIEIYGAGGATLRRVELPSVDLPAKLARGATHVWFAALGDVTVLDLRTLERRRIPGTLKYGPVMCGHRGTVLLLSRDNVVRVLETDGTLRREFRTANDPVYVTCSASGDRIGAVSDAMHVHDAAGTLLRAVDFVEAKEIGAVRLIGDDVWTATHEGVLRRYHDRILVATLPSLAGSVVEMEISDRHVIARGDDTAFVVVRREAMQFDRITLPCAPSGLTLADAAVGVPCGDDQHVYVGTHRVGTLRGHELAHATFEPGSRRGALEDRALHVFDATGNRVAYSEAHRGLIAFADSDHLLVAEVEPNAGTPPALWRWAFAADAWERVVGLEQGVTAMAVVGDTIVLGTRSRQLVYVAHGRVANRVDVPAAVVSLTASGDGKRVAAQLASGVTLLLDRDGRQLRELGPAALNGTSEALDATGALIVRSSRGQPTIWDTATGDVLIYDVDLFRYAANAMFASDGRIVIMGSEIATLAFGPDRRPATDVLRDIDCRVPLGIVATRLEPRAVTCR
jgi:serine/threonine protein kinase